MMSAEQPKGPVFGWTSFQRVSAPFAQSVESLPHTALTTSGRAAIYQALVQLQLPPNSTVLVPTYHCPTMVAPIILANHRPVYFGIQDNGLPDLQSIGATVMQQARAIIVPHYFGLAQSLHEVRGWCDARGIALIEDCAHCYFGQAGERSIGAWGDYCTASLSKFLPVPEGGILASAHHPIRNLRLAPQSFKSQIKGWMDVFELATKYKRLPGLNLAMGMLFTLKNTLGHKTQTLDPSTSAGTTPALTNDATMMRDCDMARIALAPLAATKALQTLLPHGRILVRRQQNFAAYAELFAGANGVRPLFTLPPSAVAPYVYPLWVDDADRIYREARARALPVFRWDRIWPGTTLIDGDIGPLWSQHVLQLLCHQDLSNADIEHTAKTILNLLEA